MKTQEQYIRADGHRINTLRIGDIKPDKPTLVFIHGGLDCIDMWRQFPMQLCETTGLSGIVYERWGHGKSDKLVLPRKLDTRSIEADRPLHDLFEYFAVDKVILVGHSAGGAVALLASGVHPGKVCGTIAIAPQLIAQDNTREGLTKAIAAYENGKLRDKLMKFHGDNTDILFHDWTSSVLKRGEIAIDYSPQLRKITCPVLGIYGTADNYGYLHNLNLTRKCLSSPLEVLEILDSTHYPHLDTPEPVLEAAGRFIGNLVF
ncbi:MAG: alpha/beta hydrolase [Gammaproteobacteria bacterium]|nr:MAG: alpha/beta hydrolase [Gammaproteobacteria bacterium]